MEVRCSQQPANSNAVCFDRVSPKDIPTITQPLFPLQGVEDFLKHPQLFYSAVELSPELYEILLKSKIMCYIQEAKQRLYIRALYKETYISGPCM